MQNAFIIMYSYLGVLNTSMSYFKHKLAEDWAVLNRILVATINDGASHYRSEIIYCVIEGNIAVLWTYLAVTCIVL